MNARRLTALTAALAVAALLAPATAHADEGPYDEGEYDEGAYDDARPPTAAEKARAADASIDRGFLTSHAETIGAGNWSINSYELFFLGVTHAFTDDFQLALTTALPVVEGFPFFLAISPKFVLHRSSSTVVALRGLIWWGTILGEEGDGGLGTFNGGVNLDHYFDDDGRFALHASVSLGGAFGTNLGDEDFTVGSGLLLQIEGGFSLAVARVLKLLFEIQTFALNTRDGFEFAPVVLLNYGIRFFGEDLAADLGFFKPIGDTGGDPFIMGFPFVAFSARL